MLFDSQYATFYQNQFMRYLAPFSHNASVTDKRRQPRTVRRTDDNHVI